MDPQDWCEALTNGEDLPDIHLVWSCRRIEEMELLGEALPSFLAAAPSGAETRCKISLFCTGKVGCRSMFRVRIVDGCSL